MGRAPCCDKSDVKKGPWSPEEDAQLKAYIESNGTGGNWIALPQKIGLKRCGKSCRLRWLNYLRPNIKHGGFSEEEDFIICNLYRNIGSRWSIIAAQLPGRTDNDVKNYWNTRLKKKLLDQQRKEQRARCLNLKQEMNVATQSPYWPLLPADPHLMDQESIRNLIIKLGGRFSNDHHPQSSATTNTMNNFPYLLDGSFAQDQIHGNSIMNMLSSSSSISPINSTCSQVTNSANFNDIFQGVDGFPGEPSELIYGNNQQILDGLMEGFHGSDNMVDGSSTGTSSSVESSSWSDMNSLCYPQIGSGFEAYCHPSLPQVSTFDESSYFGPQ